MDQQIIDYLDRKNDPEYWKTLRQDENDVQGNSAQNALAASLMASAGQIGTLGGKSASAAPVQQMAQDLNKSDMNALAEGDKVQGMEDKNAQLKADLYRRLEEKQAAMQAHKDRLAQNEKLSRDKMAQDAEQRGLDRESKKDIANENAELRRDLIASKNGPDGQKRLSPSDIEKFGQGRNSVAQLNDLESSFKQHSAKMGPMSGRWSAMNPYDTEAQGLQSQAKATAQMIGRYLEGGVLRAEDVPKYEAMLPQMKDTPEVASIKLKQVRNLLNQRQEADLSALNAQGYMTQGLPVSSMSGPKPHQDGVSGTALAAPSGRQEVRRQYSPSRNQTKITYGDGSEEVINGRSE